MNGKRILYCAPVALIVTACGGGGGSDSSGTPASSPLLQVGMQRQYSGSVTRSVTYTTPTATNPNSTLAYTFTEVQKVLQAPANAPASFDINSAYTYTITQDPGSVVVPVSESTDDYRNLTVLGATQFTTDFGQTTTTVDSDEISNALGNGPFTQTTTTVATYPTPRQGFAYPLQAGAKLTVPQSSAEKITFSDVNAAGAAPSNGSNVGYSTSRTESDDGAYNFQRTYLNGLLDVYQQNSDGSGTTTATSATATTSTSVSIPVLGSGVYTIPVTRNISSPASNKSYSAADWYPGGGPVTTPLVSATQAVVGATTSLPPQCSAALVQPNMFEIDSTTNSLNPISSSFSTTTTRAFVANGTTVCSLAETTANSYALLTGALVSTTTTQTTTVLTAFTQ